MFRSSLHSVVCRRTHVLFTLFVFVCVWWCSTHIVCVVFLFFFLCLVSHVLTVSRDCQFLIGPSAYLRTCNIDDISTVSCYIKIVYEV
jgi:hypothetical protein